MTAKKKARKKSVAARKSDTRIELDDQAGRAKQRDANGQPLKLDETEREAAVLRLFTLGLTAPKIVTEMKQRYGNAGVMTRAIPYRILQRAAKRGRVRYTPPEQVVYAWKIAHAHKWLEEVSVVHTTNSVDVARKAAGTLLGMVQERYRSNRALQEIHIGFAAGMSVRQIAQGFAELLRYPTEDLPKRIVFHAMCTGHDKGNPTTCPNTYFSFFIYPPVLDVEAVFVGLHAPAMVWSRDIEKLKKTVEIEEAYNEADKLDIIVTSGSDWADEHSSLRVCMERSPASVKKIRDLGGIVDVMWRPLGKNGPITEETEIRALTLMELTDLPGFIERGGSVLLMLGPCGICKCSKVNVLHTTLTQVEKFVTHVVVDSRTAAHLLQMTGSRDQGIARYSWGPGEPVSDKKRRS
jgi:DNA-binding transcriptional regulator LsrR (DeoR family)